MALAVEVTRASSSVSKRTSLDTYPIDQLGTIAALDTGSSVRVACIAICLFGNTRTKLSAKLSIVIGCLEQLMIYWACFNTFTIGQNRAGKTLDTLLFFVVTQAAIVHTRKTNARGRLLVFHADQIKVATSRGRKALRAGVAANAIRVENFGVFATSTGRGITIAFKARGLAHHTGLQSFSS